MRKVPLLTIAIPTYNRASILERLLIQLKDEKNKDFLVLISDNASTDETGAVVNKYQKFMPNLSYHRNDENLGYSGNVCKLYELAKTQYIWFLCDDDSIVAGAVEKILASIIKFKPVVSVFNCTWLDPYGRKLHAGVKRDKVYKMLSDFTDYTPLIRLTYLSIIVLEKKRSIHELKKTDYTNNVFFQLSLSLFLLSEKLHFVEVAQPIVHRNVGYKYGNFYKFYLTDQLDAVYATDHIFENEKFIRWSKINVMSALQLYISQKIGLFSYKKGLPSEVKKKIFFYYGQWLGLFILSFPVISFFIPSLFIRALYLCRLYQIHGYKRGIEVYKEYTNRAHNDVRDTSFTQ